MDTSASMFFAFIKSSRGSVSRDQLSRLFQYLDDDRDGRLQRDEFMRCVTIFYRVSRPNVDLCMTMGVTQGKLIRRLEINEAVELVEGPVTESNKVVRIRCRAMKDGIVGWAMASGSKGVVFLSQTRIHFQVKLATILTDTFAVNTCKTIRHLKEGELLEVFVWERVDKDSGMKRMK